MISAKTRNRIHAISTEGSVADRYFDVTSEVPRNTVEARISAMPRNGRSARAGAAGVAGFFSGTCNGARSSVAVAADGGVKIEELSAAIIESGEAARNDKWADTTSPENRKPICAIARGGGLQPSFTLILGGPVWRRSST